MTAIFTLLTKWGIPAWARWPFLIVTAIALLVSVKAIYDASVVADHKAEVAADTIEARDTAAEERASDAVMQAENEKDLNDAIDNAKPDGAQLAADCERLKRYGRRPEACLP